MLFSDIGLDVTISNGEMVNARSLETESCNCEVLRMRELVMTHGGPADQITWWL